MTWQLKRTRQCNKCPWKRSTDPTVIPNGYSVDQHLRLRMTIADPGSFPSAGPLRVMACHETPRGAEAHCIGWVWNQMGRGNNIALRLALRNCTNIDEIKIDGPQHETFDDTLPK
ncbi:DUF6283 family protein [Tistrella sp.]|uniref:DUF6283 family protein n=1 Tax=Tistrella sp. TaxID=2024861 RepID=UPI003A5BB5F2